MSRHPESFLPLKNDALLIMLAVANEPRHGYGIIRDVEARSDREIVLQTGALYRWIKRLLADHLIAETADPSDSESTDERRRHYRLTALGQAVVAAEVERMAKLVHAARLTFAGKKPRLA
ncbi:MAG TPA: helix-turn-helix transcriptional regulator [Gemmatimonadaceae bacterium]|nr:helix-turn-helix transcriptional regulator [Gemmatimonadaceae bacterium]